MPWIEHFRPIQRQVAHSAIAAIRDQPAIPLGTWPTPLDEIDDMTLGRMLVKRDDRAGFGRLGRSGVKARKLEGFLGFVRDGHYEEVVMPLANVTNLAFDLEPVLAALGVRMHLVIADDPPLPAATREAIFREIAPLVHLAGSGKLAVAIHAVRVAASARLRGRRSLLVMPSPGHPSAVIGAARGFLELVDQLSAAGRPWPARLYIAAAAGSTAAGFILASSLLTAAGEQSIEVRAVQVNDENLSLWIPVLLRWTQRVLRVRGRLLPRYSLIRRKENTRYGRASQAALDTCKRVYSAHGIEIDPIYGGKVWATMEQLEHAPHAHSAAPSIVFWHCGYTPDWPAVAGGHGAGEDLRM